MPAPTGPASQIKTQIKALLDALVVDGVIGGVIQEDLNTNVLALDFPAYPCAVLGTSNMNSAYEYPQSNRRTYQYDILIVQLQDNLNDVAQMENIRDAIALKFDNAVTLSTAPFGVEAVSGPQTIMAQNDKTFILFNVTIRATTVVSLTYTF
jgi:hypothetical protein